jgi:hypothetical protein
MARLLRGMDAQLGATELSLVAANLSGGAARACQTLQRRVSQSETATVER